MKSSNVYVLTLAAALLLPSCSKENTEVQEVPMVCLQEVVQAREAAHASYPGRTLATNTSNVAFRVSGTLEQVKVKEGDFVREGQVIAVMDDRDYKVQLSAVEAEYQQIKADCERIIGLYEDGSTTAQNYDKARYGLEQITAKYNHAKDQLADCVLKAPFSGYVQTVVHESHETVAAGLPVISMFSSRGLEVTIHIPASEFIHSSQFEIFTATFDVLPGKVFPLRLISIAQRANASQLYEVRMLLEDKEETHDALTRLTPGMTALVDIKYKNSDALPVTVPSGAVLYRDGQCYVFVFEGPATGTGHLRMVPVYISDLKREGSMVVSSGLYEGQKIVSCGIHQLKDGQEVRSIPETSSENVGGLL